MKNIEKNLPGILSAIIFFCHLQINIQKVINLRFSTESEVLYLNIVERKFQAVKESFFLVRMMMKNVINSDVIIFLLFICPSPSRRLPLTNKNLKKILQPSFHA